MWYYVHDVEQHGLTMHGRRANIGASGECRRQELGVGASGAARCLGRSPSNDAAGSSNDPAAFVKRCLVLQ